jgi:hypothetical protein
MINDADKKVLDYTESQYNGYIIEWAVTQSTSQPSHWMGHYRVRKDGEPTFGASIANLQTTADQAEIMATELAKDHVDNRIAEKG